MYNEKHHLPIKSWAEEDRPREKMLAQGRHNLSDAELLGILLGTGTPQESAVSLARRILGTTDNNLHELARLTPHDLMKFRGVGQAKAIAVAAALELGRRRQLADPPDRMLIGGSRDAYRVMAPFLADLDHEQFWVLLLNRANRMLDRRRISTGGVSGTVVDAKMVFRPALETLASSVILFHNHPSGNLQPSQPDIELTRKLRQAGSLLDIQVLDHLILTERGFYSFADEGML